MRQLDLNGAQAVTTFSILSALSMYREAVPSISELREANPSDPIMYQRILDADVYGAISIVLIGGSVLVLARDPLPLFLGVLGLGLISYYHRSVLASESPVNHNVKGKSNA